MIVSVYDCSCIFLKVLKGLRGDLRGDLRLPPPGERGGTSVSRGSWRLRGGRGRPGRDRVSGSGGRAPCSLCQMLDMADRGRLLRGEAEEREGVTGRSEELVWDSVLGRGID